MSNNDGFLLLPLVRQGREGLIAEADPRGLAVLVVLIAHENCETRKAFPSLARIATLSGLGRDTVKNSLSSLEEDGWFQTQLRGRGHCYCMQYPQYPSGGSSAWISIARTLITEGLWSLISPTAKKLYLALRALAGPGHWADEGWIPDHEFDVEMFEAFSFLPADKLDPGELCLLTGLEPRTFRKARMCLLVYELVLPTGQNQAPGWILPFDPMTYVPDVLARLECIRNDTDNRLSGGALRSFRATRRAARRGPKKDSRIKHVTDKRNAQG